MTTVLCAAVRPATRQYVGRAVAFGARVPPGHVQTMPDCRTSSYSISAFQPRQRPAADNASLEDARERTRTTSRLSRTPKPSRLGRISEPYPPRLKIITEALVSEAGDAAIFPARTLQDSLVGVTKWPGLNTKLDLVDELERTLSALCISTDHWLAFRNALLAKSWPEIRTLMQNVEDQAWPDFVFAHALTLIKTPTEADKALCIFRSMLRRANYASSALLDLRLRTFQSLSNLVLLRFGQVHLVPWLSKILSDLLASPKAVTDPRHAGVVLAYANNLCRYADDRAREAVQKLLDMLPLPVYDAQAPSLHRSIVHMCLESEKLFSPKGKQSRSSHQFCNGSFMDQLIPRIPLNDAHTCRWAYRVAIAVADRDRRHVKKIHSLAKNLMMISPDSSDDNIVDLLLYAKALSSIPGWNNNALRSLTDFYQLRSEQASAAGVHYEPSKRFLFELLEIVTKNRSVPTQKILSLLGIGVQPRSEDERDSLPTSLETSMMRISTNPVAYARVMQGLIHRGESWLVPKLWRVMLDRRVPPTPATLTLLLGALFKMRQARTALQQLDLWLRKGVPLLRASIKVQLPDGAAINLKSMDLEKELAVDVCSDTTAASDRRRFVLEPDPMLAMVVLKGLHSCDAPGIEFMWNTYCHLMKFPDAPVLSLFLQLMCNPHSPFATVTPNLGRETFRTLLFSKHPELQDYVNPLCTKLGSGTGRWLFSGESPDNRIERWLSTFVSKSPTKLLPIDARTDALIFTTQLFDHYMRLLIHAHQCSVLSSSKLISEEILNTLGWMKELHVRPSQDTIALAILELEECLPPPVAVNQMAMIDDWLTDWLGTAQVPSENQMRRYWKWKIRRNGRGGGWFDPCDVFPRKKKRTYRASHALSS